MDFKQLRTDWKNWAPQIQRQFPQVQVPDIFPNGALWDAMVSRLACAHDLTQAEVSEILEDHWMMRMARLATAQAA